MAQRSAAFFDLDRTLVGGATAKVVSRALRDAGVVSRQIPGEDLIYSLFSVFGENLPSMVLGRQAVAAMRGISRDDVRRAAESAVDELVDMVLPYARTTMQMHRDAGRTVVLATTTPADLIEPFARALGFDDVVATRWELGPDGTYTGRLAGRYVWSRGKRDEVADWCARHGVDLAESWAYSDSIYDEPLLSAVGHPHAVNPDARLAAAAAARRWPVLHFDVPAGVAKVPVAGVELQKVGLALCRPEVFPFARFDIEGADLVPASGPAVLCANHRSYFDVIAIAMLVARTGRTVRFLGKKEVFDAPVIGPIATAMGGIRVDRGTGSDEPLMAAADALRAGEMVAIMPQGTIPRGRDFYSPMLVGRWGAARLAAATETPVVPVGLWGTEKVWPRSSRVPNVTNISSPPLVSVRVGTSVTMVGDDPQSDTLRIMEAIMALLPAESRSWREPTPEEIRLATPAGMVTDD